MTKFYQFSQNNSGGFFKNDHKSGIAEYVIIEASSAKQANKLAESIGIYFDGCVLGVDCGCCGDRWYSVDESDGDAVPTIYGESIAEWVENETVIPKGYVHYLNGTLKKF